MPKENCTKAAIDNAALELIKEVGIENLKIREVCIRADVSIGTFYNHYDNKGDLLVKKIDSIYLQPENNFEDSSKTPAEQLRQTLLEYCKINAKGGPPYCKAIFSAIQNSQTTLEHEQNRKIYLITKEIIENGQQQHEFRTDISCQELTRMTIAFIRGINIDWCNLNGEYDLMTFA